jgi:hypothetical protein
MCLGGSPAGMSFARLCTLTLAATLTICGATNGFAQDKPDAAKASELQKKPAEPGQKVINGYHIHQSFEVGGRLAHNSGSGPMWSTLFNQTSGGRILEQSLEMRSVNPAKTPFFDTLSTFSTGYGGDPINVSRINVSKGRIYDLTGSFRRDRNYFDYNIFSNSLLGPTALIPENNSLHMFNTVRRNTETTLTLMPLSLISVRLGIDHNTHEGPTLSTLHEAGDVQLFKWFRNSNDTYSGGIDLKIAPRTVLSYDHFYTLYKGDNSFQLAGANLQIGQFNTATPPALTPTGQYESLGINTLIAKAPITGIAATTCGSGARNTLEVVNGLVNPFCSGTTSASETAPTHSTFQTDQFRFSTHYWNKLSMNGRVLYSGANGTENNFNSTFTGWLSRTFVLKEIETGALANGSLIKTKKDDVSADYSAIVELNKYVSVLDTFSFANFRVPGYSSWQDQTWVGTSSSSILTPLSSVTQSTVTNTTTQWLKQKMESNTLMVEATVLPQLKISGGWRYRVRTINNPHATDLAFNANTALVGGVFQPAHNFRLNVNYEMTNVSFGGGSAINGEATGTPVLARSNTYTRIEPNKSYRARVRGTYTPRAWLTLSGTGNYYQGKNDDPLVNHLEQVQDASFSAIITPNEKLSIEANYAYDDVYSQTDLCFIYSTGAPPAGSRNSGTCVAGAANPQGSASLFRGFGTYDAPSNFFGGALHFTPVKTLHLGAGTRFNNVNGQAEQLNPYMVPGALRSTYLIPYADVLYDLSSQWAWHGNFVYDGYAENGPLGMLASRNTHGNVLTLGVKYAF